MASRAGSTGSATTDATTLTHDIFKASQPPQTSSTDDLPFNYYDHFRQLPSVFAETRENSAVVSIRGLFRLCQITSLLPITTRPSGQVVPRASNLFNEVAALLAVWHFNTRRSDIVMDLQQQLDACNVYLTLDLRDTQLSPIEASRQTLESIMQQRHSLSTPAPIGLMGAIRSSVSLPIAILGGVHQVPQVSPTSTSAQLENRDVVPYFSRTIPTNAGDAKALVKHLKFLGVTHFGVAYSREPYGSEYFSDLFQAAQTLGLHVVGASYEVSGQNVEFSIDNMIVQLQKSKVRYFVGIFFDSNYKYILNKLHAAQLIGTNKHVWYFTDSMAFTAQAGFRLDLPQGQTIAQALQGTGVVFIRVQPNEALNNGVLNFMANTQSREYFISRHAEQEIFTQFNLLEIETRTSAFNTMVYDAIMSLGLAACGCNDTFFTGPQLYESLKNTEFTGASGFVAFHPETGTRREDSVLFQIVNLVINDKLDEENTVRFNATQSVLIQPSFDESELNNGIQMVNPYIYWDGTTNAPPALPPAQQDENLMSKSIQIVGWTLAGIIILLSIVWMGWSIHNRKKPVVRASQPVFLCMLCTGTLIMATCIITMSLQEPVSDHLLDIACMATPWLFSVGFVMSFSALFSKAYRLNMLYQHSKEYRRVQIEAKDVLSPFIILMTINIIILSIWTGVAPLHWTRVDSSNVDNFGRGTESYGSCNEFSETAHYVLIPLLLAVNLLALVFATYQTYKSRHLPPTNYQESRYIAISLVSMLEAFCLAIPVVLVINDNPSADFIVRSLIVTIVCLAILLPIFVPKYRNRNKTLGKVKKRRSVVTSAAQGASKPLVARRAGVSDEAVSRRDSEESIGLGSVFGHSSFSSQRTSQMNGSSATPGGSGGRSSLFEHSSLFVLEEVEIEK